MAFSRRFQLIFVASLIAVAYFFAAAGLRRAYVDFSPKGKIVVQLIRPFERYRNASLSRPAAMHGLDAIADDGGIEGSARSPVMLYENGIPLGPGHNTFADVDQFGAGRFAHLRGKGFVFSSSDNSDPNTNGRSYWIAVPVIDPAPKGRIVIQLVRPFEQHDHASVVRPDATRSLDEFGDDSQIEDDARSPVTIYENGTPLGPGHSNFSDISQFGAGRFAHWRGLGIAFSSSDNSNPNDNGRSYWAVLPP
jgi:hypothetical protein